MGTGASGYRPPLPYEQECISDEQLKLDLPRMRPPLPTPNGLAIASLILGIVALIGPGIAVAFPFYILILPTPLTILSAIPGVILGHLALGAIQSSRGRESGSGLAIAGLVTGYVAILLLVLAILYYEFFLLPAQRRATEMTIAALNRVTQMKVGGHGFDRRLYTPRKTAVPVRTEGLDVSKIEPQRDLALSTEMAIKANENAIIQDMRNIVIAQEEFHVANGRYAGSLQSLTLAVPPLLDGDWRGARNGYSFSLMASGDLFRVSATPLIPGETGKRSFYTDPSGTIRYSTEGNPDKNSPPIDE